MLWGFSVNRERAALGLLLPGRGNGSDGYSHGLQRLDSDLHVQCDGGGYGTAGGNLSAG